MLASSRYCSFFNFPRLQFIGHRLVSRDESEYWLRKWREEQIVTPAPKRNRLLDLDEFGPTQNYSVFSQPRKTNNSNKVTSISDTISNFTGLICDNPNEDLDQNNVNEDLSSNSQNQPYTISNFTSLIRDIPNEDLDHNNVNEDLFSNSQNQSKTVCNLLNSNREFVTQSSEANSTILKLSHVKNHKIPSVTKVLSATMSEESRSALARWEKMKIEELGLEGFQLFKQKTFKRGHTLHSMMETYMKTGKLAKPSQIEDEVSKRHLVSISQVISQLNGALVLESSVVHPVLGYCGIVDCVARLGDTIVVVDWKTSEREKNSVKSLYDNPIQVAAYMGAINHDDRYQELGNISKGVVVVVYNSGFPAFVHQFSANQMEKYWREWCFRLAIYRNNV